jgi:hypothetical protein
MGAVRAQQDFCQSAIGTSHLLTPGTATCEVAGASTIVSLSDNTLIEWDTMVLTAGQELQFRFEDPSHTVVNRSLGTAVDVLGRTRPTVIGGTLASNGNVVILSPNNWLRFTDDARVETASLVASGLDSPAGQFFADPGELEFRATPDTNPTTLIRGRITTTAGDVVLVGKELEVTADIEAAGGVAAVTGESVRLRSDAPHLSETTGGGQIIQGGRIEADADIAFVSQQAMSMVGEMVAGSGRGRFFARVDDTGRILIGQAGLTVRAVSADFSVPPTGEVAFIPPAEGDNPGALSPAVNEFPALGSRRTPDRVRPTSGAITSRAGTGFSAAGEERRKPAPATRVTPVRKRSFFRTRATVSKKD